MAEKFETDLMSEDDNPTVDVDPGVMEDSYVEDDERVACLVFLSGPLMGHSVPVTNEPKEVGRADDADIVIADEGVSRRHARFYLRDRQQGAYVEDLESSNGVYVNGERIERFHHLCEGDKVTLATETILKFTCHDQLDEDFQQRLLQSAIFDQLTGVHNRAFFNQTFKSEFTYAKRHDDRLGLILFDIDHFKAVNDTHGHLAGDAVLEQFGQLLRNAVREEDFVARYGGEEFAMICRGLSREQAYGAAERLRQLIESATFTFEDLEIRTTFSAGVASFPEQPVDTREELIKLADDALYCAKDDGRNRVCKAPIVDD